MGAKLGGEKLLKPEWPARILCSTGNSPLCFLKYAHTSGSSSIDRGLENEQVKAELKVRTVALGREQKSPPFENHERWGILSYSSAGSKTEPHCLRNFHLIP